MELSSDEDSSYRSCFSDIANDQLSSDTSHSNDLIKERSKLKKFKRLRILDSSSGSEDEDQTCFGISKAVARKYKTVLMNSKKLKVILKPFNLKLLKSGIYKVTSRNKSQVEKNKKTHNLKEREIAQKKCTQTKSNKSQLSNFKSVRCENDKSSFKLHSDENRKHSICVRIDLNRLKLNHLKNSDHSSCKNKTSTSEKRHTNNPKKKFEVQSVRSGSRQIYKKYKSKPEDNMKLHKTVKNNKLMTSKRKKVEKCSKSLLSKGLKITIKKSALNCSSLQLGKSKVQNSIKNLNNKKLMTKAKPVSNKINTVKVKNDKQKNNCACHSELSAIKPKSDSASSMCKAFDGDIVSKIISESTLTKKDEETASILEKENTAKNCHQYNSFERWKRMFYQSQGSHNFSYDEEDPDNCEDANPQHSVPCWYRYDTMEVFQRRHNWVPHRYTDEFFFVKYEHPTLNAEEYINRAVQFTKEHKRTSQLRHKDVAPDLIPVEIEYVDRRASHIPPLIPEIMVIDLENDEFDYNEWNPEDDYQGSDENYSDDFQNENNSDFQVDYSSYLQQNPYVQEVENNAHLQPATYLPETESNIELQENRNSVTSEIPSADSPVCSPSLMIPSSSPAHSTLTPSLSVPTSPNENSVTSSILSPRNIFENYIATVSTSVLSYTDKVILTDNENTKIVSQTSNQKDRVLSSPDELCENSLKTYNTFLPSDKGTLSQYKLIENSVSKNFQREDCVLSSPEFCESNFGTFASTFLPNYTGKVFLTANEEVSIFGDSVQNNSLNQAFNLEDLHKSDTAVCDMDIGDD